MGEVLARGVRRIATACAAVLVALAVAGCTGSSATPQTIYVTPPPGPTTPGPSPALNGALISSTAPDGRWTVTFNKPVVSGLSDAESATINDAITAQVNNYISSFTGQSLPALSGGNGPSTLEGDFTIALASPNLLSLRFSLLEFVSGGAHPTATPGSLNFDLSNGKTIALTDILTDPATALPVLSSKVHDLLAAPTSLGSDLTWS